VIWSTGLPNKTETKRDSYTISSELEPETETDVTKRNTKGKLIFALRKRRNTPILTQIKSHVLHICLIQYVDDTGRKLKYQLNDGKLNLVQKESPSLYFTSLLRTTVA